MSQYCHALGEKEVRQSSVMEVLPYLPELLDAIIADIDGETAKKTARQIIKLFDEAGLTIKVKHIFPLKPSAYYRVLCFIKKSKETVIINTKQDNGPLGVAEGMNIQLRIEDGDSFTKLDDLTENIRGQILNAGDCRFCSSKCDGKRYVFTHHGTEYIKCQYLCNNFRLTVADEHDVGSITKLVEHELVFATHKK